MKKIVVFLLLLCVIMNLSARKKNQGQTQEEFIDLSSVGPVFFSFKYDNLVVETKVLENGKKEVLTKDYGQPALHLFIADSIKDFLNTNNKLEIVDKQSNAKYSIRLQLVTVEQDNVFIKIEIFDEQGKRISTNSFTYWHLDKVSDIEYKTKVCCEYISSILK